MKSAKFFFGVCLMLLVASGPAWAVKGMVGLGVGMAPDYQGSDDYKAAPMLMFKHDYDSGRFVKLYGTNLKVNLLADKTFSFGPVVNYRFGRDDVDNNRVDAMKDIDDSLELGAFASYRIDNLTLGLEFLADVSGEVDSKLLTATADYRFQVTDTLAITPGLYATYAGKEYLDTFFGVNPGNVGTSGLPYENISSNGFKDVGANVTAHLTPWQNWGLMGVVSVSTLVGDAKDSPVVDDEGDATQWFAGVMATYRWSR